MSELWAFMQLGFRHIVDISAMDHILFLLALAAIYRWRDWRDALWVISAFTIGHSTTLALAVTGTLTVSSALVEFLIPLTIVVACVENLLVRDRRGRCGGDGTAPRSRRCSDWCTARGSRRICGVCSSIISRCRCSASISESKLVRSSCSRARPRCSRSSTRALSMHTSREARRLRSDCASSPFPPS